MSTTLGESQSDEKEGKGNKINLENTQVLWYTDKISRTDRLLNMPDIWSQYFALRSDHQFPSYNQ